MLLKNKNALIYGAGGAIGGAVARTFASEGARSERGARSTRVGQFAPERRRCPAYGSHGTQKHQKI